MITLDDLWNWEGKTSLTIDEVRAVIETCFPIPVEAKYIEKGTHIFRARPTKRNDPFSFYRDMSYPTELWRIDQGRAQKEKHAVFYGAISTAKLKHAIMTVCRETSKLMTDGKVGHQTFCVGVWEVKRPFMLPILMAPKPISNAPFAEERKALLEQELQEAMTDRNRLDQFQRLINREFSKRVHSDQPRSVYTISAAFAEFIYDRLGVGLGYPSVETDGMGQNIALLPHIVENCLKPAGAQYVQFHRSAENETALCQYQMGFGNNHPIEWIHTHPKYSLFRDFIPHKD